MSSFMTTTYVPIEGTDQIVEHVAHDIPDEDCVYRMDISVDHGREWVSNGMRWREQSDAARWTRDLTYRWFSVTDARIVRCADEEIVEVIL
jgi:hypothetical protein